MIPEYKNLLIKDISARVSYGVKFTCNENVYTAKGLDLIVTDEVDILPRLKCVGFFDYRHND
jgi:hypothetical protein